ncbi:MAG: tRNA (adenosine(37)-N6)-threonylcarbamoyltransferase complex dimerization subunit type 1 TsaB [Microbacteriaceae bacterium]|nr:tRNA (adenosine(37)-N6)-threonylcarbamoyltransferase complex dimerization subunit type 1 TsaB [Microbacteriaceae bacterium]
MLLAIDTSAGTSVAVVDSATGVCVERSVDDTRRHAEVIGELIIECLHGADIAVAQLSGVAIGMGPGPFTGLRVGIAAATAFGLGAELPLRRVVSHDALAFDFYRSGGEGPLLVTTDARRRERYWSAYRGVDGVSVPHRAADPGLDRPENIDENVTAIQGYHRVDADWVSAASLGRLAEVLHTQGREFVSLEPLYLRSPDVTLASAPKRVSS